MNALSAAWLLSGFVLLLVGLAVLLQLAERFIPGLSEWLDRNVGEPRVEW